MNRTDDASPLYWLPGKPGNEVFGTSGELPGG